MTPSIRCIVFVALFLVSFVESASAGESRTHSNAAADPIQAMINDISADSIRSYIQTLEGFYTRHTNSDTTSTSKGIGAARRWVFNKFQQFSQQSGGKLITEYFDFSSTTIQGFTRLNRNIQARLPGTMTGSKDRYFIVSGHVDGRTVDGTDINSIAPSANDDGSGTAISLELARVMSKYQFDATLIFMAVVGEDEGLYGSDAYAKWARSTNLRIDGMITNDVVGNIAGSNGIIDSMSVRHFSSLDEATTHRQLTRYLKREAEPYLPGFTINLIPDVDRPGRGGDHQSFQAAGFTAVRFTEPNENLANQHSATDLLSNMSPTYTARVARVNAVGLAKLAWAPAAPVLAQNLSPGNGTSLIAKWTTTNTEPDLAGYRVAVREAGSLTYSKVLDAGMTNQLTVTGLTPGVPIYLSLSAYDTSGYGSVFSPEVLMTPAVVPAQIRNVGASSGATQVAVRWDASPELDVAKYRIYRSTQPGSGYVLVDSVTAPTTVWSDTKAQAHGMYYYEVTALDQDRNESVISSNARGRLATHDSGILIVDGTRDGLSLPIIPTNKQVDDFYTNLTSSFTIAGQWDCAESLKISPSYVVTDADLSIYSTVIWHSDVRGSFPVASDSTEIKEFLANKGNLILSGWKLSTSLSAGDLSSTTFAPGSFVPAYLKINSMQSSGVSDQDFIGATAAVSGYPSSVAADSLRIPDLSGTLVNMDVFGTPLNGQPTTQTLYTYISPIGATSPRHGKPVALRYLGSDYKLILFDFPLYYMKPPDAKALMQKALFDFGEVLKVEDRPGPAGIPQRYQLSQNYPNPFNPSTTIEFSLPTKSNVDISVFNLLGEKVETLVSGEREAGNYRVSWDAGVASGIYFFRLNALPNDNTGARYSETRKMLLLR